ncbi:hypothetical protein FN846DRAFT_925995 [Sphaerosporella brunnea]|uniref:Uncharacterized protein n=1 Tax=Sphaerosporella brunnea TaxID=1250544 RepID=A0A5J5FAI7_9PEZI|nr:hypothetical protein FN846DRAFT_925995 [Sphaerosporella brunnea]
MPDASPLGYNFQASALQNPPPLLLPPQTNPASTMPDLPPTPPSSSPRSLKSKWNFPPLEPESPRLVPRRPEQADTATTSTNVLAALKPNRKREEKEHNAETKPKGEGQTQQVSRSEFTFDDGRGPRMMANGAVKSAVEVEAVKSRGKKDPDAVAPWEIDDLGIPF